MPETEIAKTALEILCKVFVEHQSTVAAVAFVCLAYIGLLHWMRNRALFDRRKIRIDKIDKYIEAGQASDGDLDRVLRHERKEQVFTHIFGYPLDLPRMRLLAPIVEAENRPISWPAIKDARQYIRIEDGQLVVKYGKFEVFEYRVRTALAPVLLVSGMLLPILLLNNKSTFGQCLACVVMVIPIIVMALGMLWGTFGFSAARSLEHWLKKTKESTAKV